MAKFRFEDLEIWKDAILIADELFNTSDELEGKRLFGFSSQLRSAGMSLSNHIAEGSGSSSKKDFSNFLNIAKRNAFENANILLLLHRRTLIEHSRFDALSDTLDHLCSKISNFQRSLK